MIETNPLFEQTVKESHVVFSTFNVIKLVQESTPLGPALTQVVVAENVGITSGSVTADSGSNARRSFQATVPVRADSTYYDSRDPLTNYPKQLTASVIDTQVQIFYGVSVGERAIRVPVGVFRVDEMRRRNNDAIVMSGVSLEAYVVDNVETVTKTYSKTDSVINTIRNIIIDSVPYAYIDVDLSLTDAALGSDLVREVGSSPWGAIEILSTKIGADTYCGPDGRFKIKKKPELENTSPVLTVESGSVRFETSDGTLVERNGGVSRADTFNAVVVSGQSSDPDAEPVSYVLKLDASEGYSGPLTWGGPFGKKARVLGSNPILLTTAACKAAAQKYITRYQALSRTLDISMVPNPALEPDDVIRIDMLDGTFEHHMIKKIDMPLGVSGAWKLDTMSTKKEPEEEV